MLHQYQVPDHLNLVAKYPPKAPVTKTRNKHGSRPGYNADLSHFFWGAGKSLCCMFEKGGFEEAFQYL